MRKTVLIMALLVLAVSAPLFAELELGVSWTPLLSEEQSSSEDMESITGFHVGYQWWGIFYAAWDSLIMPPDMIGGMTGYLRPGFLNLFNAGLRLRIGPIIGYTTVGVNNIYVYKQEELSGLETEFGANLRVGAGLKFGWWGLNVSGTSVFPSFERMTLTLAALAEEATRDAAIDVIMSGLVPSINLTLYF
jgi:hypothetical protein